MKAAKYNDTGQSACAQAGLCTCFLCNKSGSLRNRKNLHNLKTADSVFNAICVALTIVFSLNIRATVPSICTIYAYYIPNILYYSQQI